jgi:hypothetical protein
VPEDNSLLLSSGLFVHVKLHATLSRLSLVMDICISLLLGTIASQGSSGTADGTLNPIANTLSKVTQLSLGFLALTLKILFTALLFEVRTADEVAGSFFGAAHGLIPLSLRAVAVVFGWRT